MASTNRTGRVSSIDYAAGTYEVTYFDRGRSVTTANTKCPRWARS